MPSDYLPTDFRAIYRSALSSRKLNALSRDAELLYFRVLLECDDHGRIPAAPGQMAIGPFSKRFLRGDVGLEQADGWLNELSVAGLVTVYDVAGERFLQVFEHRNPKRKLRGSTYPSPLDGVTPILSPEGEPVVPSMTPSRGPEREREREREREKEKTSEEGRPPEGGGPTGDGELFKGVALTVTGKASTKKAGTPQADLVEWWGEEWGRTRGQPWRVTGVLEYIIAAKAITLAGGDLGEAKRRATLLLDQSEDAWTAKHASLELLVKRWNQIPITVRPVGRKTKAITDLMETGRMLDEQEGAA